MSLKSATTWLVQQAGILIFASLLSFNGYANPLDPPDPKDNKIRQICTAQMINIYFVVKEYRNEFDDTLYQRVTSLLMAAEIDAQFRAFPACFNKLERAKQLISQADYEVPPIPEENEENTDSD